VDGLVELLLLIPVTVGGPVPYVRSMRRLLPPAGALVLVLAACGGSHRRVLTVTDAAPIIPVRSVQSIAATRRREASRKAEKLLRRVVLPPGAVRVRRLPAHSSEVLLASQLGVSMETKFADRHAFWSVRRPLAGVDRFLKAHPTAGLSWDSGGSDVGPGPPNAIESFYGRLVGGRPVQRLLSFALAREKGRTFIRVDAGAAWVYPRSPREVLPAGVREIDISGGGVSRHVTARTKVARIGRWFDALNIVQPGQGVVSCAIGPPYDVKFVFRAASGAELAGAIVPDGPTDGCHPIRFTIGGRRQTPLIDSTPGRGRAFIDRVQRLLRIRFPARG
jgi:hypothetical protein